MSSTKRYRQNLTITLPATRSVRLYSGEGRLLMKITMNQDEDEVTVLSVPFQQVGEGALGNTGWGDATPTEAELGSTQGVKHDLRPSPQNDIRGGV